MSLSQAVPRAFEVEVRWDIAPERLLWPSSDELNDPDATLAGNHHYQDLRDATWSQVIAMAERERGYIDRIVTAKKPQREAEALFGELDDAANDSDEYPLLGLDLGVAAAVLALSAMGQIPALSCNGGAFGGTHRGEHPYVAFYAKPSSVQALISLAREAGAGMSDRDGLAVLYGRTVTALQDFALAAVKAATRDEN